MTVSMTCVGAVGHALRLKTSATIGDGSMQVTCVYGCVWVRMSLKPRRVNGRKSKKNKNQQQEQLPVAFAAADTNGDGNVTKEEFVAALKEKLGEGGASSKFASLDKNSDGKLSKEEYSGGATEPKKRRKKDK